MNEQDPATPPSREMVLRSLRAALVLLREYHPTLDEGALAKLAQAVVEQALEDVRLDVRFYEKGLGDIAVRLKELALSVSVADLSDDDLNSH